MSDECPCKRCQGDRHEGRVPAKTEVLRTITPTPLALSETTKSSSPGRFGKSWPDQVADKREREFWESVKDQCTQARNALSPDERKGMPLWSGVIQYFPDALLEVAKISKGGNDQHNLGCSLQWSRGKSQDELDTVARHLVDAGKRDIDGQRHTAKAAWRILAALQKEIEAERGIKSTP